MSYILFTLSVLNVLVIYFLRERERERHETFLFNLCNFITVLNSITLRGIFLEKMWTLSTGMCALLNNFQEVDEETVPVFQVVDIVCQRDSQTRVKRFRLQLSDGIDTTMALCNDHVGDDVYNNIIECGCVIQIDEFIATEAVNGKAIMVMTSTSLVSPPISRINSAMQVGSAVRMNNNTRQQQNQEINLLSDILQDVDNTTGNKYTIKATITNRSDLRHWGSSADTGCYFWIDLIDSSLATIRGVLFRESAQKWTDFLTRNDTYLMTNCVVKNDSTHGPGLHFSRTTQFTKLNENIDIPVQVSTIGEVESRQEGTYVNVIGFVLKILHVDMVRTRATGEEIAKRVVIISDETGIIEVTLWGQIATSCELHSKQVLLGKQLKVHKFSGKTSLSYIRNSCIKVLPETDPAAMELIKWNSGNQTGDCNPPIEPEISFIGIREFGNGFEGRVIVTITDIQSNNVTYKGCSRCRKKMNSPQCGHCNESSSRLYFIANVTATDSESSTETVTFYDQSICQISGLTAEGVSDQQNPLQVFKLSLIGKQIDINAKLTNDGFQCTRVNLIIK